jgi:transposase-like protein
MRKQKDEEGAGSKGQRKRRGSAEKLRIVLAGLEPGVEVSDLCRREGLSPAQYYQWKRTLLGAADRIFERKEHKPSAREERLRAQLTRAKDVIAEITAENLELKKTF